MRKVIVLLFLLCCLSSVSQPQKKEVDSLLNLIKTTTADSLKVRCFLKLEYAYRFSDYKKGLEYAEKGLAIAKKINWQKGLALTYNSIGGSYLDRSKHSEALEYYAKSLTFSEKNSKIRLSTLTNISNIYLREKNLKLSQNYINDAYKIANKLKDNEEIAYCYYQMGLINRDKNNIKEAENYFKKSLALFRIEKNLFQIAEVTTFLGEVTRDYKQKLNYLLESKLVWDKVAPEYQSAINNSLLISKTYVSLYKNDSLKKVSDTKKSTIDLLKDAENLANQALLFSKTSKLKQYEMDSYEVLSEIKALKNDYPNAYTYSVLQNNLKDSIFSQESKNQIAKIESQKELELRDKQIEINKISLKAKEKQKWFLVSGMILLAIIGSLLLYQNKNREKTNKKLQNLNINLDQANKSKIKLLNILNHDLRSPVNSFIHYIQFQKENPNVLDAETKSRIENESLLSAKNLLQSMEDILLWSKDQMENFDPVLKPTEIKTVFEDTKKYFSAEKNTTILFENPENIIFVTDENFLKTIIRNLTANAIKASNYSEIQPKKNNLKITWKSWQIDNKIYLSITDNGLGANLSTFNNLFIENFNENNKSGLGFHLIRDLAKAINCEVSVTSQINESR